ncbi:MAG: hypothetical protein AVDCRST_MAG89-3788 [uncultured Gemmatimonadetes bacterium]|uniref:TonB-dependent transporter Oar-like beta-barrel domain-containing protein n=1 Tax=uncultured Gemmatimonadota bacterium TaxID=203437 RepID=A0A6J4MJX9_9BACT|nr:MAG: hypothetical protein AVDCRST_MAG89-3788 [uncultured Gemmatimonadota bacterium]
MGYAGGVRLVLLACALAAGLWTTGARAQSPAVAGRVVDPAGAPVPEANVTLEAAASGAAAGSTRTDAAGRYTLPLSGAGAYRLTVRRIGFVTATVPVDAGAAGTVTRDVRLSTASTELAGIEVRAPRPAPAPLTRRRAPGEQRQSESGATLSGLPLEPGELADVAALAPGVARTGEGEGGAGLSVGAQPSDQNQTTLDGASYGGGSIPSEAIERAGVVTSAYDAARGQFSGGEVFATTRAGTNRWGGAVNVSSRPRPLQFGTQPGAAGAAQKDWWGQLSAGGGGPLLRDRSWVYGALQLSRRAAGLAALDPGDAAGLARLGIDPDSARRFGEIVRGLGVPAPGGGSGAVSEQFTSLLRLDHALGERHRFVARLDGRATRAAGVGASAFTLPGGDATVSSASGGVMGQLTSRVGRLEHEVRLYASGGGRRGSPRQELARGAVRVSSAPDGADPRTATLRFGGGSSLSPDGTRGVLEVADEWRLTWGGGASRTKVGGVVNREHATSGGAANENGTFTFQSLSALEAGIPSSYTRTLGGRDRRAESGYGAVYLAHVWAPGPRFSVTGGARWEARWYPRAPGDSAAAALFGRVPGVVPAERGWSPRLGFSAQPHRKLWINGGTGEFRGKLAVASLLSAQGESGGPGAPRLLSCVGAAAPAPDWEAYVRDPDAIPSACASGEAEFADQAPALTLFDEEFAAPRVWHTSVGGRWQVGDARTVTFRAAHLRGSMRPLARDLNRAASAPLFLEEEGGRPVFAPASAIDPSGMIARGGGRIRPEYASVREVASEGSSNTLQLTAGVATITRWGGRLGALGVHYTFTDARDDMGGVPAPGGALATTAGDPNRRDRAPSDLAQRHAVQFDLNQAITPGWQLGMVGRLASGFPLTPMVAGDINGDGRGNDRAFVLEPANHPDPLAASAMESLLRTAPAQTRACLRRQLGRVAGRNSCRAPWASLLELQATFRPGGASRTGPLQLTFRTQNLLAGVDHLLHGDRRRGWGQLPLVDPTLLQVRGWDADRRAFRYDVNPEFGRVAGARGGLWSPFALVIQGRVALGADPARQALARMVASSLARRTPLDELRRALAERLPNVPARVLGLDAPLRLGLTPAQVAGLRAAADSAQPRIDVLADSLAATLHEAQGVRTDDQGARQARLQGYLAQARAMLEAGRAASERLLTGTQWNALPATLRRPAAEESMLPGQRVILEEG